MLLEYKGHFETHFPLLYNLLAELSLHNKQIDLLVHYKQSVKTS